MQAHSSQSPMKNLFSLEAYTFKSNADGDVTAIIQVKSLKADEYGGLPFSLCCD